MICILNIIVEQNINFLFCLSMPICLPLSIVSRWEDSRKFETTFLSFLLCKMFRYSDILNCTKLSKKTYLNLLVILQEIVNKSSFKVIHMIDKYLYF